MRDGEAQEQQAGPGGPDSPSARVGAILRRHREARGISLRAFARRCGLSPAHVSKAERGLASPSMTTLARMVDELGIDGAELFRAAPDDGAGPLVLRAAELPVIADGDGADGEARMLLLAQTATSTVMMLHGGSGEWLDRSGLPAASVVHVIDGGAHLEIEGEPVVLDAGDVAVIPAGAPHRVRVPAGTAARVLLVSGGPAGAFETA